MDHQPARIFETESDVIGALGGPSALGTRLGLVRSAVSQWARFGIPYNWHQPIVELARSDGIAGITPERLFAIRQAREAVVPRASHRSAQ